MFKLRSLFSSISGLAKPNRFAAFCKVNNVSTDANSKVLTERREKLFLIGLNRPEKRNCVDIETANLLVSAFEEFENDDSLYVAILYGVGGNFCAGMDLNEVSQAANFSKEEIYERLVTNKKRPMGPTQKVFSKPTIAAISGFAVAGGLELALLCDLRVVEETAVMGVYCRRFGVPLIDGGTVRLPQIIGFGRAMDMILTGRGVQGKEALEFGLANQLTACGSSLGQAVNLAHSLCKFPQQCMRADRRSAFYSAYEAKSIEDALKYEWEHSKEILFTESWQGASKFVSGLGRHGKFNIDRPPSKL